MRSITGILDGRLFDAGPSLLAPALAVQHDRDPGFPAVHRVHPLDTFGTDDVALALGEQEHFHPIPQQLGEILGNVEIGSEEGNRKVVLEGVARAHRLNVTTSDTAVNLRFDET